MKFGKVEDPSGIDFTLPNDHPDTKNVLAGSGKPNIYVGCANWNRAELKNFYPRGTKNELVYYATQFNSIELNATFYNNFPVAIIEGWYNKTPAEFRFFPKLYQGISHWKRLKYARQPTDVYLDGIAHLQEKLGMLFLQMPDNFGPKDWETLRDYLEEWPSGFPLALELRHPGWYDGTWNNDNLYALLEKKNITHIITDSAGRRDLLHMRLTTSTAFVRYNSVNTDLDYKRLDDWFERLKAWSEAGIENIYFFVHQSHEEGYPLFSAHLIRRMNNELGTTMKIPANAAKPGGNQINLFAD